MNFGPHTPTNDAHRILDRAVDAGINLIDTADQYGGSLGVGTTESILGEWLARRTDRDRLVLATKVHEPMGDGPNDRGLSAAHIRQACDASLTRLGVDHIDLYQLHHLDREASWDEIYAATDRLVAAGKITYLGTSNFPAWVLSAGMERAGIRSTLGPVSEQSLYHLANRTIEMEVIPAAQHYGIGILPWSPLGGGLLAGAASGTSPRARDARDAAPELAARLDAWEQLCADIGHPPATVALSWVRDRPGVVAPIAGVRTEAQLDDALRSLELTLDAEVRSRLDEIFPGPGPAPEAYAW
jgi:aryl-alcohol dehydrogenase-like predicted oxidoreductase